MELPELPARLTMSMVVSSNVFKYTEEQMRAYGAACAQAALEAAARVCEDRGIFQNGPRVVTLEMNQVASAIRAIEVKQ
jgi:hypothetical protein